MENDRSRFTRFNIPQNVEYRPTVRKIIKILEPMGYGIVAGRFSDVHGDIELGDDQLVVDRTTHQPAELTPEQLNQVLIAFSVIRVVNTDEETIAHNQD